MPGIITPRRSLIYPRGFRAVARPILDPLHPLSRGLGGCWPFGETTGLAKDLSPNGIHIPLASGYTAGSSAIGGLSTIGNGTGVQLPATPFPGVGTSDSYSISVWLKNPTGSQIFFSSFDGDTWLGTFGGTGYSYNNDGGGNRIATTQAFSSTWAHFVAVYQKGGTAIVYYNGVQSATATSLPAHGDFSVAPVIYNFHSFSIPWTSDLQMLRCYTRALTPVEVAQLYAEPFAGIYSAGTQFLFGGATTTPPPPTNTNIPTLLLMGVG